MSRVRGSVGIDAQLQVRAVSSDWYILPPLDWYCTCVHGYCPKHERELDAVRSNPVLARFRAVLGVIGYAAAHCPEPDCRTPTPDLISWLEHDLSHRIYRALKAAPAAEQRAVLERTIIEHLADLTARGVIKAPSAEVVDCRIDPDDGSFRFSVLVPRSWLEEELW